MQSICSLNPPNLWLIGIVLSIASVCVAEKPASSPATLPAELPALIQQLSSDQWNLRQKAQDQIIAMGVDVRPAIEKLSAQTTDPQIKSSAEAILDQLATLDKTGPTLLTIHLSKVPANEVITEMERQAKCELPIWPPNFNLPNVTINADRAPLLQVLRDLCIQAKLVPQYMGSNRPMALMAQQSKTFMSAPSVTSGAYLVFANSITALQSAGYSKPEETHSNVDIDFILCLEPKLQILGRAPQADINQAIDDAGKSWAPQSAPVPVQNNPAGEGVFHITGSLKRPPGYGKTLTRLKGAIRLQVPSKTETLEVADILNAKNLTKVVGSRTFQITTTAQADNRIYSIDVDIVEANPTPGYNPYPNHSARLLTKDGRSYGPPNGGGGGGNGHYHYNLYFDSQQNNRAANAPPQKLIWDIPTETKEIAVPFEFANLALPPVPAP